MKKKSIRKKPAKAKPRKKKRFPQAHQPRPKKPLEERILDLENEEEELFSPLVSEKMREKLLKEEFKLRKKQPTAWTKTKYRKYAMFAFNRKKKDKEKEEDTKNTGEQS